MCAGLGGGDAKSTLRGGGYAESALVGSPCEVGGTAEWGHHPAPVSSSAYSSSLGMLASPLPNVLLSCKLPLSKPFE